MVIYMFLPFISEAALVVPKWLKRRKDQGWGIGTMEQLAYKTKTTQFYQYLDLHSGPQHVIHFKYSNLLNITYVTLMYGVGQPILFLVAVLSYTMIWLIERFQIAYFYQIPPKIDDSLVKNALSKLTVAPLLFLANGYWMLSNRQMFHNELA